MIHFVIASDKSYLLKGIACIESIRQNISIDEYAIHYCGMDIETTAFINTYYTDRDNRVFADDIKWEQTDPYQAAAYFTKKIQDKYRDPVLYVDADVFFWDDPMNCIMDCDYAFSSHNIPDNMRSPNVGKWNVGVLYFNNSGYGRHALELWESCVMNPDNEYAEEYGTASDQKYLELIWENIGGGEELPVAHNAWWNYRYNKLDLSGPIWMLGMYQQNFWRPLVYTHFSHFYPDFENDTFKMYRDKKPEWNWQAASPEVIKLNRMYFETLKKLYEDRILHDRI